MNNISIREAKIVDARDSRIESTISRCSGSKSPNKNISSQSQQNNNSTSQSNKNQSDESNEEESSLTDQSKEYVKNELELPKETVSQNRQREVEKQQQKEEQVRLNKIKQQNIEDKKRQIASNTAMSQISSGDYKSAAYTFANAGMQTEAFTSLGVGLVSNIINDIQASRQKKIKYHSETVQQLLKELPEKDEYVRKLFLTKKYPSYLKEEKVLRNFEQDIITSADWLYKKEDNSYALKIINEIKDRQYDRLNAINYTYYKIIINSDLKDYELIKKVVEIEKEEEELAKEIFTEQLLKKLEKNKITRAKNIFFEAVKQSKLSNHWDIAFYLNSGFQDDSYDKKALDFFKSSNYEKRKDIMSWALYRRNNYVTNRIDLNKISLLLNNGKGFNYYTDFGSESQPFYKYVRNYSEELSEIINSYINNDIAETGKTSRTLYKERKHCKDSKCASEKNKLSTTKITKSRERKINKQIKKINRLIGYNDFKKVIDYFNNDIQISSESEMNLFYETIDKIYEITIVLFNRKQYSLGLEYIKAVMNKGRGHKKELLEFYLNMILRKEVKTDEIERIKKEVKTLLS